MPRQRLELPPRRIVPATVAAQIVGARNVKQFLEEVAAGIWPDPHPCTLQRADKGWDTEALNAAIDRGSQIGDPVTLARDKLTRGLGNGDGGT